MTMLDQSLAGLLAREAIRDLPNRYCDCVWRGDAAGIAQLFAVEYARRFEQVDAGRRSRLNRRRAMSRNRSQNT